MSDLKQINTLYQRIDDFCKLHGLSHYQFTTRARVHSRFMKNLREGRSFSYGTLQNAEAYLKVIPQKPKPAERVYGRHPCPRCGVRGDIGCEHQHANEGRSMYA